MVRKLKKLNFQANTIHFTLNLFQEGWVALDYVTLKTSNFFFSKEIWVGFIWEI